MQFSWLILTLILLLPACLFSSSARIVYIGDSHSLGTFGQELNNWMRINQFKFDFIASGGSSSLQWLLNNKYKTACGYRDSSHFQSAPARKCLKRMKTPSFENLLKHEYLEQNDRKLAIIALGSNFQDPHKNFNRYVRWTTSLIEKTYKHGYECVWIGPPNMRRIKGKRLEDHYNIIRTAIRNSSENHSKQSCTLIDSRDLSTYPVATRPNERYDGIHFDWIAKENKYANGVHEAKTWANGVILILASNFNL